MESGLTEYPTEEKFFEEAALENQKSASAKQITHFCFSFQADEKYLNNMPISVSSESEAKDLASDLKSVCDMDEMETLELKRMEYAKPEVQKKAIKEDWRYKIYDADEIAEYAVLYEYNGDTYRGGMTLLRYDEKWYILKYRVVIIPQFLLPDTWNLPARKNICRWQGLRSKEIYNFIVL